MSHVLYLTPGAYGVNGGIGLYNRDIAEAILAARPDATLTILPRTIGTLPYTLPPRTRMWRWAAKGKAAFLAAIAAAMLAPRPDLVLCAHINLLPLARWLARRHRCPLMLMVYGIDVWDRPARRHIDLAACDAIWSISDITTRRMNDWAALPPARYVQLPNAIHLDNYAMGPRPADLARQFGLADKRVILTLTRLPGRDRHKGVDEMLEILPDLRRTHPDLHYIVAGDGPDRPRLEARARDLGVADFCSFAGFVAEDRKADYFRLADVFALPGRGEGFGFVFLEALACGIPCVGSSVDGSREALRDGQLGLLVDPDDRAAIIAAVTCALAMDKEIPEGLGYFAWPQFVARVDAAMAAVTRPDGT